MDKVKIFYKPPEGRGWYNGERKGGVSVKEERTAVYDEKLRVEAYRFRGATRPFPSHFHDYYVIGLVEAGERVLSCRGRRYVLAEGDILLFSPGDSHACVQSGEALDYRGVNISREVMLDLVQEVTGRRELPRFAQPVIRDEAAACCFRSLHRMVMEGNRELGKEEGLLLLLFLLLQRFGQPLPEGGPQCGAEVERACAFMEEHFGERICLDQICRQAGLSRSALLRAFAREKGVTPYNYLENVRIGKAKQLLEQGVPPAETALRTGFSDQSHFTNCFTRFIGLTPGMYRELFPDRGQSIRKEGTEHGSDK